MSRLVAKILLCILMFPLAVVCYCGAVISAGRSGYKSEFILAGLVNWLFVAVYWTLLWRNAVRWTSFRVGQTALAALVCALLGAVALFALNAFGGREVYQTLASIAVPTLWMIATVFCWRETVAERASRLSKTSQTAVSCPTCGYNLTGLTEARCPECGSKFTLNELLASQPNQSPEELT